MDLSQQIESEQRRLQERSQIAHLQGQLDDMRHSLEQQSARAQLATEQARQVQDLFAQMETRFEALVGEAKLQEQTRLRTHQSLQREVSELHVRVEESGRQVLALLSQFQDVQESLRLLRQQIGQGLDAGKQVQQQIEELRAQGMLREERLARLDNLIGQLRQSEEGRQQEVRQVRADVEVERQNMRRQAADLEHLAADLRGEGQEYISRLNRLAEVQRQCDTAIQSLEERLGAVQEQFDRQAAEIQRVERGAVETFLQGQERLESLRQSSQREWSELRVAEERRGESQNAWLRRIEELYHDLDERLARRDEEIGRELTGLAARVDVLDRAGEQMVRDLLDVMQRQIERGAAERLTRVAPAAEQTPDRVSRETSTSAAER